MKMVQPEVNIFAFHYSFNSCPEGSIPNLSASTCVNIDECELWQPCFNGVCVDLEPEMGGYECHCVDGYHGTDCNIFLEETVLQPSTDFVIAIVLCILVLLCKLKKIVFVFVNFIHVLCTLALWIFST